MMDFAALNAGEKEEDQARFIVTAPERADIGGLGRPSGRRVP